MSKDTILLSEVLENGLQVTIYDRCKRIAWDRYYVQTCCVIEGKYTEEECAKLLSGDVFNAFLDKYPENTITFEIEKERNFVDEPVKEDVLNEMVEQISGNFQYIGKVSFAENLLAKTVEDFIEEYNTKKELGLLDDGEEVEEPDDFSACFK